MIRTNPWQAYILTTAIISAFYYAAIGWKFYRPELKKLLSGQVTWRKREKIQPLPTLEPSETQDETEPDEQIQPL